MKLFDNFIKKSTKTASEEVKKEVQKSLIDLVPAVLTFGSVLISFLIFNHGGKSDDDSRSSIPFSSKTYNTTNNYFLGEMTDEIIEKILKERD